jgi:hypothetical protein
LYGKLTIFGEGSRKHKVIDPDLAWKYQVSRPGPNRRVTRRGAEGGLAKKMTRKWLKKFR